MMINEQAIEILDEALKSKDVKIMENASNKIHEAEAKGFDFNWRVEKRWIKLTLKILKYYEEI